MAKMRHAGEPNPNNTFFLISVFASFPSHTYGVFPSTSHRTFLRTIEASRARFSLSLKATVEALCAASQMYNRSPARPRHTHFAVLLLSHGLRVPICIFTSVQIRLQQSVAASSRCPRLAACLCGCDPANGHRPTAMH